MSTAQLHVSYDIIGRTKSKKSKGPIKRKKEASSSTRATNMSAENWARDNEEELSAFNTAHLALDDEQEIDVSLPPPGCVCVLFYL